MLCEYHGTTCYYKYHVFRKKWVYVRADVWDALSPFERMAYVDSEKEGRELGREII